MPLPAGSDCHASWHPRQLKARRDVLWDVAHPVPLPAQGLQDLRVTVDRVGREALTTGDPARTARGRSSEDRRGCDPLRSAPIRESPRAVPVPLHGSATEVATPPSSRSGWSEALFQQRRRREHCKNLGVPGQTVRVSTRAWERIRDASEGRSNRGLISLAARSDLLSPAALAPYGG